MIIEWGHSHVQITKNSMCCAGAIGDSLINVRLALSLTQTMPLRWVAGVLSPGRSTRLRFVFVYASTRHRIGNPSPRHRLLLRLVLASHSCGNHLNRVLATQYTIVELKMFQTIGRMTASHKNIWKVNNKHCYKQFLWQNI